MCLVAVFGLIFAVAGLWLLARGIGEYRTCQESPNWPSAAGTITESSLVVSRRRRSTSYTPRITYTYVVEGQTYAGRGAVIGDILSIQTALWDWRLAGAWGLTLLCRLSCRGQPAAAGHAGTAHVDHGRGPRSGWAGGLTRVAGGRRWA